MERFQCVSHLENGLDIKTAGEFVSALMTYMETNL